MPNSIGEYAANLTVVFVILLALFLLFADALDRQAAIEDARIKAWRVDHAKD